MFTQLQHKLIWLLIGTFSSISLSAQQSGQYIYGQITSKSGQTYEGFMRWGDEEMTWHDIFNSTKTGDQMKKSKGRLNENQDGFDWSISSLWKDKYKGSNHVFACRFGDIAFLYNRGKSKVDVELKNGAIVHVKGGSNDIDATIQMQDYELGIINIEWKNVRKVSFFQSPPNRNPKYSGLLYGTAETARGQEYRGFIEWDQDERMGDDILHGKSSDGSQEIPFNNVVSIERSRNGSEVTFKSGRTMFLRGSNDVSNGNRGISVYRSEIGRVDISWDDFQLLELSSPPAATFYNEYPDAKALEGFVSLYNGDVHEGQIIFDLDEIWDIEFLDANDDDIHYEIPFKNISRIVPKNRSYSIVYLRNGDELLLGEANDVSQNNNGLIIISSNGKEPVAIEWEDIDEIVFR